MEPRKTEKLFKEMVKKTYTCISVFELGEIRWKMNVCLYFIMQGTNGETGPPGTKGTQGLKVNDNLVIMLSKAI